ncbi:hypothetical protein EZV62_012678 [Acer yangbiense]|uniref:Uncharacterized protein n=1 Tax=Acer yangbiense TaxID=1000413 RepID=A0A5C7HWX5_9ROSI|nr:hypothetical protein EZV62_012678 [Acer yangbiense]
MATNLLSFRPAGIQVYASSGQRKPADSARSKSGSSTNWWTPVFGWSSEPDYIDSNHLDKLEPDPDARSARSSRFSPGCLTEEKAKQLRMMTKETSFHDAMYHSAIASRLASDFKNRSDRLKGVDESRVLCDDEQCNYFKADQML